jgi:hypothetical protein
MSGSQDGRTPAGRERDPRRLHTRLVVKCVEWDEGKRPIAAYGYLSPSITFVPDPPLQAGVPAKVRVAVHNYGNMDATGVLLEVTYNVWIGNQAEGMEPIANLTLPTIPADGEAHVFELDWTPPPTLSVHACVHARVFDTWSLQNETATVFLWDSLLNPQAGNRNFSLIPVADPARALVLRFQARNFGRAEQRARVLVTAFREEDRVRLGERAIFPLPFRLERLPAALLRAGLNPQPLPPGPDDRVASPRQAEASEFLPMLAALVPALAARSPRAEFTPAIAALLRDLAALNPQPLPPEPPPPEAPDARLFGGRVSGFWPAEEPARELLHDRFGLVEAEGREEEERLARMPRRSLSEVRLREGEERLLAFVIPPEELPARGQRRDIQVHYQTDHGLPVMHHLCLHH